jgi:cyanophycinase
MRLSRALLVAAQAASLLALARPPSTAAPDERLVLVGGGERPKAALARFVAWAGGAQARLLVVTWASGEPQESCEALLAELGRHAPREAVCAPEATLDRRGRAAPLEAEKAALVRQALGRATGVFFTGGDQARVMDALADPALVELVRARHASGVVFGGTSAGTAIMSPLMITGDGDFTVIDAAQVVVRPGLGLLRGVILDQHYVKRSRHNRLFGLVLRHPDARGIGIDEDTALLVENGRSAEVVGRGPVVIVDAMGSDRLEVRLLQSGQKVVLAPRR